MTAFKLYITFLTVAFQLSLAPVFGQETVFSGLKSDLKRADRYFNNHDYPNALQLYLQVEKKGKGDEDISLKIARSYYQLNEPAKAIRWFQDHFIKHQDLPATDAHSYAESLVTQKNYTEAVKWYRYCLQYSPENQEIMTKIWRIKNIEYLYVDSSYFEVKTVPFNTGYAESSPAFLEDRLIFMSNRKDKGGIVKIDPITNLPFQTLYQTEVVFDSSRAVYSYQKFKPLFKERTTKYHQGPLSANGSVLIFTRNAGGTTGTGSNLQLQWAEKGVHGWKGTRPFKYNSQEYSISHPSLSSDGKTLYFVSDMPGGFGGQDLYKCSWSESGWSNPQNLGNKINTSGNETAPFIHNNQTLYFASDGHAGFGGLDVFKVLMVNYKVVEVQNIGYPINTPFDDFGFILDEAGTHGYFASNRKNGGFDDDLFEVVVDLQTYPLNISGIVRFNDPDWEESSRLELLPHARLHLIDNVRGTVVYETYTDAFGMFSLMIPYSSMFKIQVNHEKVGQPTVSLEIPKNRKLYTTHEIVVVKEKPEPSKGAKDWKLSSKKNGVGKLKKKKNHH